jgi:hypothetical protein
MLVPVATNGGAVGARWHSLDERRAHWQTAMTSRDQQKKAGIKTACNWLVIERESSGGGTGHQTQRRSAIHTS